MYNLVQRFTFNRASSFLVESLVATIPVIFALLLQKRPIFFQSYSTTALGVFALMLVILSNLLNFLILSFAGYSSYSPKLHNIRFISTSTILYYILSSILVYSGYIAFVYPISGRLVLFFDELLAGTAITSIYAVLMVSAHGSAVISTQKQEQKIRDVNRFLGACEALQKSDTSLANRAEQNLLNSAEKLVSELEDEPMSDSNQLKQDMEEWLSSFRKYNTGGRKKMVGDSTGRTQSEPWSSLHSQFQYLRKELSDMTTSAHYKAINARKHYD